MLIEKIEVWDFCPTMRDGQYAMSHVVMDCIWGRIYRAVTDQGQEGWGETVFPPSVPRSEQIELIAQERELLGSLVKSPAEALLAQAERLRQLGKGGCGVAFGLETVWYDLAARESGSSLSDFLGGVKSESVPDYFSISERTLPRIRERIKIAGTGRTVFQLKIGVGSFDDDADQLELVLGEIGPGQIVLADANGGWDVEGACRMLSRFSDPRLLWEEPCDTYTANREVMKRTGRRLMVDQCAADPEIAQEVIKDGLAHSLCIKPAFLGGLSTARAIRDSCARTGTKMRIDGPWCGDIATAAILHLAVGAPQDLLVSGCDLREPVLIEPDMQGVITQDNTRISPPGGAGLGLSVTKDALGEPEATYR